VLSGSGAERDSWLVCRAKVEDRRCNSCVSCPLVVLEEHRGETEVVDQGEAFLAEVQARCLSNAVFGHATPCRHPGQASPLDPSYTDTEDAPVKGKAVCAPASAGICLARGCVCPQCGSAPEAGEDVAVGVVWWYEEEDVEAVYRSHGWAREDVVVGGGRDQRAS
jgi:hypothetical protein